MKNILLILLSAILASCASKNAEDIGVKSELRSVEKIEFSADDFQKYWYGGKAELTSYNIEQARYGELHPGTEVLVFVTEDYNIDKQVKREMPSNDAYTSVLKLNRIKRFTTGIYDYSMFTSVFKSVDAETYPNAFKITSSAQDWCGQSWSKLQWDNENGYLHHLDSYFEAEQIKDEYIGKAMTEDEIFNTIRINPKWLPNGEVSIIPSLNYARLAHQELKPAPANAAIFLKVNDDQTEEYLFTLDYESGRQLKVYFQSVFPFRINGWEEKRKSGFGTNAKWLTTKATIKSSLNTDYWSKNSLSDGDMRKMLGL